MQRIKQVVCVLAVGLVAWAHGEQAAAQAASHAQHGARAAAPAPAPARVSAADGQDPDTTITIRSVGSDLEFLPSTIAVKQGKRLRIRYVNQGTFPHNIVIVKGENDIDPLGAAAFNAGSTGYVPLNMKERMHAFSPLAPPGETIEFTFVVPPPGEYPFVCLYPGHYNMMLGTLRSLR